MSGAAPRETPSIRTSRSARPPIGKSGGASSAAIKKFIGVRPDPEALVEALDPLQPRLYSIAGSPKIDRTRMALCVDAVRYPVDGRNRLGVASTFLGERARPGDKIKVYVQEAQQAESNAFSQLVEDARVDGLMRDRGITEAEARTIVYEERDAASRAASQAQQAKEAELVAFVEEIGDGLKLRDDRASEILYRVEQGWSDRKLARLVERLFHGQLHDRRTEVAERVITFAREQSVPPRPRRGRNPGSERRVARIERPFARAPTPTA